MPFFMHKNIGHFRIDIIIIERALSVQVTLVKTIILRWYGMTLVKDGGLVFHKKVKTKQKLMHVIRVNTCFMNM